MENFPLIKNNITKEDLKKVINYLKNKDPVLTQSSNVNLFEKNWSKWLGVKYSVFVNSGSSANLLSMTILKSEPLPRKPCRQTTIGWLSFPSAFRISPIMFNYFVLNLWLTSRC